MCFGRAVRKTVSFIYHMGARGAQPHDVEVHSQLKQLILVHYMKIQELGENISPLDFLQHKSNYRIWQDKADNSG